MIEVLGYIGFCFLGLIVIGSIAIKIKRARDE